MLSAPDRDTDRLPRGLAPLQRFRVSASNLTPGFPQPGFCSALRFSQPLSASLRPIPPGLVSCRFRSWGSPFRALPYASAASTLIETFPLAVSSIGTARCLYAIQTRAQETRTLSRKRTALRRCTWLRLQGFGHLRSPLPSTGGLDRLGTDALLGFFHFRVFT